MSWKKYVEKGLPLLSPTQPIIRISEDKADSSKQVAFASAIPSDNDIQGRVEGTHHGLITVGLEAVDGQSSNVHVLILKVVEERGGDEMKGVDKGTLDQLTTTEFLWQERATKLMRSQNGAKCRELFVGYDWPAS